MFFSSLTQLSKFLKPFQCEFPFITPFTLLLPAPLLSSPFFLHFKNILHSSTPDFKYSTLASLKRFHN